jgi:hypothetical protein
MFRFFRRFRARPFSWAPFASFSDRRVFGALMTFDRK